MLDHSFTNDHLQPLIELCVTVRLKCLSNIVEKYSQGKRDFRNARYSPSLFFILRLLFYFKNSLFILTNSFC